MPFYEIIFEPGTKSVAFYDSDEEALDALGAHHAKALAGQSATPQSMTRTDLAPGEFRNPGNWVAERIKRVLVYDDHPATHMENQIMPADELKKELGAVIDEISLGGEVSVMELAARVRALSDPMVDNAGAQESQFKATEVRELDLSGLEA
jgi:hypothetical protein